MTFELNEQVIIRSYYNTHKWLGVVKRITPSGQVIVLSDNGNECRFNKNNRLVGETRGGYGYTTVHKASQEEINKIQYDELYNRISYKFHSGAFRSTLNLDNLKVIQQMALDNSANPC